ncbi:hypothetical protein [Hymenobacter koreensis]|uniref:Uncharacterized protein n=1 Tax=Hymenobacter koreensis TaxID=1084523 RepID=A0ABP8J5P3_9BACT
MPEKLQTLLFILLGIVVFVISMVRKAREAMRREAQERKLPLPGDQRPTSRPVRPPSAPSFDDLLQQMKEQNRRGQATTAAPTAPTPETTPGNRPIPREVARETRTLEAPKRAAQSLEEAALDRPARSQERQKPIARRADTLPRVSVAHGNEDYWSRKAAEPRVAPVATGASIARRLHNPADVRTAFILSEVLQRRFEV